MSPEHSEYPEDLEGEKDLPKRKVLKIDEMALFLVDEQGKKIYLGESGNPSYRPREDAYEYDPEQGLLVKGHKETAILDKDDLAETSNHFGYVSVDRVLGGAKGVYSENDFEERYGGTKNIN